MKYKLNGCLFLGVFSLFIVIADWQPRDHNLGLLKAVDAATRIGGEDTETVENACCLMNPDCDQTELLCTNNPTQLCKDGFATGVIVLNLSSYDECVEVTGVTGDCVQSTNLEECAIEWTCVYNEILDKCVQDSAIAVEVPEECTSPPFSNCPGDAVIDEPIVSIP